MADAATARLTPNAGRRFGLTVGGALIVLAVLFWWRGRGTAAVVLLAIGCTLVVAGALAPARLGPVYTIWMGIGKAISKVTTPIILGILYFLIVTPLGIVMRLVGRDPLRRALRDDSYWTSVPSGGRSNLDNQF
ncbi:MAG TPA: SxtJ family membrane protein [Gemmatimonadales bacterium]|nr:SxtJ family membrane protein [Gemmatimonadales bacterium]